MARLESPAVSRQAGDKAAYVELLGRLQRRWSDPANTHWKTTGEGIIQEMDELFRMDPRRNSFYQWLKGRRGPGDLPYAGYHDPGEEKGSGTFHLN